MQPRRASQTMLRHADECPMSARLYSEAPRVESHPKARGTALHLVEEKRLRLLIEQGESSLYAPGHTQDPHGNAVPEDEQAAKRAVASFTEQLVSEVRAEHPELHCTSADWDKVRLMAYHLAVANPVDVSRVVAIERLFVLDVLGWEIVGKVDVASITGETGEVVDYKTSLSVPSQERYEDSFQGKLYASLLVFGQPVSKVRDPKTGEVSEVRHPGMGSRLGWVKTREIYPRYLHDDGTLSERSQTLTRTDLNDFRVDLGALVARVDEHTRTGDWPAVPGSHCFTCPDVSQCPLPAQHRGPRGSQEGLPVEVPAVTAENAAELGERWHFLDGHATAIKKALRAYSAESGEPVRFGRDLVLSFGKDSQFRKRRLAASELRAEKEARALTADEKWGEDAPWTTEELG
jgi:hypothetical protein